MALKTAASVAQLSTSATAVLTAPANDAYTVAKILLCNTNTTTTRLVTIYHAPTGAAAATGNIILYEYSVSAKETKVAPLSALFVTNGGILYAKQDTGTDVNIDINYSRVDQTA